MQELQKQQKKNQPQEIWGEYETEKKSRLAGVFRSCQLAGAIGLFHVLTYFFVGSIFLILMGQLPESQRAALDFFQFYQPLSGINLFTQAIRGLVMGVVCLPLLSIIRASRRPWLLLTGVLWGIGIFGSVEPLPGSFEGMLYTITTPLEHGLALAVSLAQMLLLSWVVCRLPGREEELASEKGSHEVFSMGSGGKYLKAFILLHVATYFVVGATFYNAFSVYQEAMESMELFQYWRPLENLVMPFAILFGQFVRGLVLALLFRPFYTVFFHRPQGWIPLFTTLWGMTFLSAVSIAPWVIQEIIPGHAPVSELLVGMPEVTVQMLLFSISLYAWQRRIISAAGFRIGRDVRPSRVD